MPKNDTRRRRGLKIMLPRYVYNKLHKMAMKQGEEPETVMVGMLINSLNNVEEWKRILRENPAGRDY